MAVNPIQRELRKIKSELLAMSKDMHSIIELLKKDRKYSYLVKEDYETSFTKIVKEGKDG
tara:strand:- start:308 stop:487 length:180 start_codon:yes stop_codon:yes gene_type:complete